MQSFSVMLFTARHKMFLSYESVEEIFKCEHSINTVRNEFPECRQFKVKNKTKTKTKRIKGYFEPTSRLKNMNTKHCGKRLETTKRPQSVKNYLRYSTLLYSLVVYDLSNPPNPSPVFSQLANKLAQNAWNKRTFILNHCLVSIMNHHYHSRFLN